jgi:hypothetical protein
MTKEQFLAGAVFHRKGNPHIKYTFVADTNSAGGSNPGHINEVGMKVLGGDRFHACVKHVNDDDMEVFCSIMGGKTLYAISRYDEFEVCEREKY